MTRYRGAALGALLVLIALAMAWIRPQKTEARPLEDLVPDDALVYAGFQSPAAFEAFLVRFDPDRAAEWRRRTVPLQPHLAGAVAFYLDRERRPVLLARLRRLATLSPELEVDGDALVWAETPAALARHRARKAPLASRRDFQSLGRRGFVDLAALALPGRLADFPALGFDVEALTLRGSMTYSAAAFRTYLERYVHAPRSGGVPGQIALTESFPRIWEEILAALEPKDRERVEREAYVLGRDYFEGRSLAEFFGRIGPAWGFQLDPPALWIDVPEELTATARAMITRAVVDGTRVRRQRDLPPLVTLREEGPLTHATLDGELGKRWHPSYRFHQGRLVVWNGGAAPEIPPARSGSHHVTGRLDVPALAALLPELKLGRWAELLGRIEFSGRFTSEGFQFELLVLPK